MGEFDMTFIPQTDVKFRELVDIPSTTYATFGLYRYPAKFIPHVVAYILKNYTEPGSSVFDPFAGYGTVGFVSRIYGVNYELWDLNPLLAKFHELTELKPTKIATDFLVNDIKKSREKFIPDWSNLSYWYPDKFLPELFRVWGFYHSLDDGPLKSLLTIPLLKVSRKFSYDDSQRQKLSRSPLSMKRINDLLLNGWKNELYLKISKELETVLERLHEYALLRPKRTECAIKYGVDTLSEELKESKDNLITSPPYLQSQEYIRQAKMDLFWLGYSEDEIKRLGKLELPYREAISIPIHSDTYELIKSKITEAHMLEIYERYFNGVLGALTRLQKRIESRMFLFVGRSSLRGITVPIDTIFAEHFMHLGWGHESTLVDNIAARQLFSYRFNPATGIRDNRTATENLVILRRESG